MGSALRRYKNAKAVLYKCQEREDRVKELPGRGGEIRVSNSRERDREIRRSEIEREEKIKRETERERGERK